MIPEAQLFSGFVAAAAPWAILWGLRFKQKEVLEVCRACDQANDFLFPCRKSWNV